MYFEREHLKKKVFPDLPLLGSMSAISLVLCNKSITFVSTGTKTHRIPLLLTIF